MSWTEVNNLNNGRIQFAGCGASNTAALAFGGNSTPDAATETWNGTSWTEVNDLNTGGGAISGCGTQTAALRFGNGSIPTGLGTTESWNGTNWTTVNYLNVARYYLQGAGTNTAGLAFGGQNPSPSSSTEEWNVPGSATEIITTTT